MTSMNAATPSRRRRRSRRTIAAVVGAAAVVAVGGVAFASGNSGSGNAAKAGAGVPATSRAAVPVSAQAPAPASAPPRVVAPGQRITDGLGNTIWLTTDGRHVVTTPLAPGEKGPAQEQAKQVLSDNFGRDSINARVFGGGGGVLYTGAYRGSGALAKVTVEVAGETLEAQVVTLAGTPGWAVYYVDGPAVRRDKETRQGASPVITGYTADGRVLAKLAPPAAAGK